MDGPSRPSRYVTDFPHDAVLRDYTDPDTGLRMLVVRGPLSFCAYVGVAAEHPLAGLEELRFEARGLTWQGWGTTGTPWPQGWYWWGWDYARLGDVPDWDALVPPDLPTDLRAQLLDMHKRAMTPFGRPGKRWTLEEAAEDALDVLMELKQRLAESELQAGRAAGQPPPKS